MLEAVQVIHDEKIVHSDLKPANFLLVEGSLKLIDFGIAKAIANDTTNIHREGQLGTANYMSPEAATSNPVTGSYRKLGRASDVWSLGCILYQMVYGKTPYSDILNIFQKLSTIANPDHKIEFPATTLSPLQQRQPLSPPTAAEVSEAGALVHPTKVEGGATNLLPTVTSSETGTGASPGSSEKTSQSAAAPKTIKVDLDLVRIMKGCLERQAKDRLTIPELLEDPFLHPYRQPASVSSGQAVNGTVTLDVDVLRQVMQASMQFGADRVTSKRPEGARTNGETLFSTDTVNSATERMLAQ